jgi:hypothetical protein
LATLEARTPAQSTHLSPPRADAPIDEWITWLFEADAKLHSLPAQGDDSWWLSEASRRISAILALLRDYMPWLLPEYSTLRALPELATQKNAFDLAIDEAIPFSEYLEQQLANALPRFADNKPIFTLAEQLRAALPNATRNLRSLTAALHDLAQQAQRLVEDTEFNFLADPGRQILSIGYDVRARKLHEACYDMIASEARIATFVAIAGNHVSQESWFKLGREHVRAFGDFLLLSWTGTMFEYLMPSLWMRSYPDTLISRTLGACVRVQRAFARDLNISWGISESGGAHKDDAGHYHYQAYGIPQIALWDGATAGPVVSPYSSFLALGVDSVTALRNLRRMASMGWIGAFGFYESADFAESSKKPVLVREWMAHHQGMSLLAILNLLHDNRVQRWFHANPEVKATELLLHELPVSNSVLKARLKE